MRIDTIICRDRPGPAQATDKATHEAAWQEYRRLMGQLMEREGRLGREDMARLKKLRRALGIEGLVIRLP